MNSLMCICWPYAGLMLASPGLNTKYGHLAGMQVACGLESGLEQAFFTAPHYYPTIFTGKVICLLDSVDIYTLLLKSSQNIY